MTELRDPSLGLTPALDRAPAGDFGGHLSRYRTRLGAALDALAGGALEGLARELEDLRRRQGRLYVLGNGGSAATASHLANDLCAGLGDRGIDAVALADSTTAVTAAGNDHGFEQLFVRLLAPGLRSGDLVLVLSGSGRSPNLVQAVGFARERGARTAAVVGMDGGVLRASVDIAVHVPTDDGDYGPAEDAMLVIDHVLSSWLRDRP